MFDDFLADSQPHSVPGIVLSGVQALKNDKDYVPVFVCDADAVIRHRKQPPLTLLLRGDANDRSLLTAKLDGISDQVLEELKELGPLCRNQGKMVVCNDCTALFKHRLQIQQHLADNAIAVRRFAADSIVADSGIGQQIEYQGLHAHRTCNSIADVLVGVRVKLSLVALRQKLGIGCHHAQRFLQVVGGHVRELLQVPIGACQFLNLPCQIVLRKLALVAQAFFLEGSPH